MRSFVASIPRYLSFGILTRMLCDEIDILGESDPPVDIIYSLAITYRHESWG